ncbi:MAG TPA: methionyl-tRNA formyltransferase [Alphaproteobacteria bacterium]|nr:methionyl-tRNA formyltransferase [Alphaproteobacteria bacterium]HNS43800.1 methionyl-tRNA formyltransferase [Alphaproteobacteria bacterium]
MSADILKVVFMGTPDFSVPALENLIANPRIDVIAVYTQPPRPAGRGQQLRLSPVHQVAERHNIPVYTPRSFKKGPQAVAEFAALHADVAVVAAYGLILPKDVLDAPKYGCLNIHASILPRWRGAAPIQRAIEAGDTESGITIMQMDVGLDTGAMILKRTVAIRPQTTGQSLHDSLSALGSSTIEDVLEMILNGEELNLEIQDDALSCYAPMLSKDEGHIDWSKPAAEIDRKVRAFTPWPGCWSLDENSRRFKILEGEISSSSESGSAGVLISSEGDVVCGDDSCYRVTSIQPESGKPMSVSDAINGGRLKTGQKFV